MYGRYSWQAIAVSKYNHTLVDIVYMPKGGDSYGRMCYELP
nr:MAG TPA: hypothetical protein [Caudoviricetes sp.]